MNLYSHHPCLFVDSNWNLAESSSSVKGDHLGFQAGTSAHSYVRQRGFNIHRAELSFELQIRQGTHLSLILFVRLFVVFVLFSPCDIKVCTSRGKKSYLLYGWFHEKPSNLLKVGNILSCSAEVLTALI